MCVYVCVCVKAIEFSCVSERVGEIGKETKSVCFESKRKEKVFVHGLFVCERACMYLCVCVFV